MRKDEALCAGTLGNLALLYFGSSRFMPQVVFFGDSMTSEVVCPYDTTETMTLLELARAGRVPLGWYCARGTCGRCAVRVTVENGDLPTMGNRERNVLTREGRPVTLNACRANWRLACQYPLNGADLRVEW